MSLTLDDDTRTHLERIRSGVAREFGQLPEHEVNARFDQIVVQLASEASFANYIPVLAWRYSRESLRTIEGLPGEFRAP
jgi:hypothetical protein